MKKIISFFCLAFFSSTAFAQWTQLNTGNATAQFECISFKDSIFGFAGGMEPATGLGVIYKTTDGGATWSLTTLQKQPRPIHDMTEIGGTFYAVGDSGAYFIYNAGLDEWDTITKFTNQSLHCIAIRSSGEIFAGGANGVLFRTNPVIALDSRTQLTVNKILLPGTTEMITCGEGANIWYSNDDGLTFDSLTNPFWGFLNVNGAAIGNQFGNDFVQFVGDYGFATSSQYLNPGLGPQNVYAPANTSADYYSINYFPGGTAGVITGEYGFIFRTADGGLTWSADSAVSPTVNLYNSSLKSGVAYLCGTLGTILKSNIDISSVNSPVANPVSAAAFPNPFSDELNVVVDLKNPSSVELQVTDVTGRIVLDENEGNDFSGKNKFNVQGMSALTGGIYFVKVMTENGVATLPVVKR